VDANCRRRWEQLWSIAPPPYSPPSCWGAAPRGGSALRGGANDGRGHRPRPGGGVTPGGAGMRSWGRGANGGRTRSWAAGVSRPMISRDVRRLGELVCVAGKEVRGWLGSGME
jgi:hypothetical protein